MKFILPMPPSINQTYGISESVMYKRQVAKEWEKEAGWKIKVQWMRESLKPFSGAVQVGINWFYKTDRDIDAGIKLLFDLLQRQRIIINDRQIRRINHVDIEEDLGNPRVEVVIEELL